MDKIILEINNISTYYKKFSVCNVTFSLKQGDILGLVGRSGSGKSTIINTVIGLKQPKEGDITLTINGQKVDLKDHLGYSPQENSLYPLLTIEENLKIFGKLQKVSGKDVEMRSRELLKILDLESARKKRIIELSGGMKKRADLAVTLINNPKIIILDEPFTGLDISLQSFIWNFLIRLSKEGKIIIISSHLLSDIQRYCNHFGLVHDGRYYDTYQIALNLKRTKEQSLERFLQRLFNYELNEELMK